MRAAQQHTAQQKLGALAFILRTRESGRHTSQAWHCGLAEPVVDAARTITSFKYPCTFCSVSYSRQESVVVEQHFVTKAPVVHLARGQPRDCF